jgi:hypothetical protein
MAENHHQHGAIRIVSKQCSRARASGVNRNALKQALANSQGAGAASIVSWDQILWGWENGICLIECWPKKMAPSAG